MVLGPVFGRLADRVSKLKIEIVVVSIVTIVSGVIGAAVFFRFPVDLQVHTSNPLGACNLSMLSERSLVLPASGRMSSTVTADRGVANGWRRSTFTCFLLG